MGYGNIQGCAWPLIFGFAVSIRMLALLMIWRADKHAPAKRPVCMADVAKLAQVIAGIYLNDLLYFCL